MAKKYVVEYWDDEQELLDFLNDPASAGMKPISIYPTIDATRNQDFWPVTVWWETEDSNEG